MTLTLEIWPGVMDNSCVKYHPDPTWQWGIMDFWYKCTVTWTLENDLGSRSWHTLGSWTTNVWNIIQIREVGKKLWPGHDVNRQTYRQGDFYIPHKALFAEGIISIKMTVYEKTSKMKLCNWTKNNNTSSRLLLCIRFVAEAFWSEEVLWRRGPPVTYFCPARDPPLAISGLKTTTLVRNHEYLFPTKFHLYSPGGSREVENAKSLQTDGWTRRYDNSSL